MSARQLKSLIETGHYKPQSDLVAEAMLQRRGMRLFLERNLSAAGRTQSAPAAGRPAI